MTEAKGPTSGSLQDLDGRIGTIESELSRQGARYEGLHSDVERLTHAFEGFARDVRSFMQSTGRLDMRLVATFIGIGIAGVGMVLTIGGMWLKPTTDEVRRHDEALLALQQGQALVAATRWARGDQERYEDRVDGRFAIEDSERAAAIEQMDETLQREMRLLDDALQREMRMLLDAPLERLAAIEAMAELLARKVDDSAAWMAAHEAAVSPVSARHGAWIEALQEDVAEVKGEINSRGTWMMDTHATLASKDAEWKARLEELERQLSEVSTEQRARTSRVYRPGE